MVAPENQNEAESLEWKSTAEEMTKQRTLMKPHCEGSADALAYLKKNSTKAKNVDSNPESFLFILQKVIVMGNSLLTSKFVINKFIT